MDRATSTRESVVAHTMEPERAASGERPRRPAATRRNAAAEAMQASLGNRIVQRQLQAGIDAAAGRGRPLDGGVRAHLQPRLNFELGATRVHTDNAADRMAQSLGALAFTTGSDIFFRAGAYDPRSRGGMQLLVHELAHVKQAGGRAGAPRCKHRGFSRRGDVAEQRADAAAEAVLAGRSVPDVGSLPEGQISCFVDTFGGRWDTTQYAAYGPRRGMGDDEPMVGANITLEFLPNKNVPHTDKIGLIQTVRSLKNGVVSLVPGLNTNVAITAHTATTPGRIGLAIDRVDDPSPIYGSGGTPAKCKLKNSVMGDGNQMGSRSWFGANTPARLIDECRVDAEPNSSQTFEVTAVLVEGKQKGKYLGAVEWGWTYAGGRGVVPQLLPLTRISNGNPSGAFLEAADAWNNSGARTSTGAAVVPLLAPI